jgi:hypothetical protein
MSNSVTDIPVGLRVPAQVPLDAKLYIADEASLMNLGISNNLAFTYYEGMIIYCVLERRRYEWREGLLGEVGLLPTGFTYPTPLVVNGVIYSGKTFNFFIVIQNLTIGNVGGGTTWYKGFNIPGNIHEFKTFTSTGLLITFTTNEVNIENKSGTNVGTGVLGYKGVNSSTKLHEFRTFKSLSPAITITQVGDEIQFNTTLYNTLIQAGTGITVTGNGTALTPYIISLAASASPWLRGDIKEVDCTPTYMVTNFLQSGPNVGLGIGERTGWAICNGYNGTHNDKGKVIVAYGNQGAGTNYPTLGATGGEETHTLSIPEIPEHDHIYTDDANAIAQFPEVEPGFPVPVTGVERLSSATGTGGGYTYYTSKVGGDGAHNNMQPYVVRLKIMKL